MFTGSEKSAAPKNSVESPRDVEVDSKIPLVRGGPFYRAQEAIRLLDANRWNLGRRITLAIVVCWVPLLVITLLLNPHAAKGLLSDYPVNVRMLIAIPVLLAGQIVMEGVFRKIVLHISEAGLLTSPDVKRLDQTLLTLIRLRDSAIPEAVIVLLIVIHVLAAFHGQLSTIVVYSTDNGNELMMWPDGGYAPFRGEKGTTWEGGLRVPLLIKWPGHIPAGREANGLQSHEDLYVTLAAAAGLPNLKQDLLTGYKMGDMTYKVHLDGYNNLDYWTGKTEKTARREMFYYDETDLMAIRVDGWKMHISVKPEGSWWDQKYYPSVPYVFNLLMDPMEKMDPQSHEWGYIGRNFFAEKLWAPTAASPFLAAHLKSLQDYQPRQGADILSMKKAIDETMKKMDNANGSSN